MRQVVIIGGGISGLTTAYYLSKAGIRPTLIEAQDELGGILKTDRAEGCIVERGADSFLTAKPWALELIDELGLSDQVIGSNDHLRATWIWKNNRFVKMPEGMKMMTPTKLGPMLRSKLIGPAGKLKIVRELLRRPMKRDHDVPIAEFVADHYGRDVVEYVAEPLLAGVYGGDIQRMSTEAVLPKFLEWERTKGSLTRAAASDTEGPKRPLFSTLRNGLNDLIQTLIAKSDIELIRGTADRVEKGYRVRVNGDWMETTQVVVACKTEAVLPSLFPPVEFSSSTVVALIYNKSDIQHPLNGFGFLVPKIERRSVAACTWMNTKFEHRAPPDKVVIRCFVSGNVNDVAEELRQKMGITAKPMWERISRWPESMPQYTMGHKVRVEMVEAMLKDFPGLHVTGNAYYGVGIPDCIKMATEAARRVLVG
jgi:oxygen-dependent protoporphyrinogen oxidase